MMKNFRLLILLLACVVGMTLSAQKIAILSDIHVTPGNANEDKLIEAIDEINGSDCDVVLMTGDLTNEGSDVQLKHVKSLLDRVTKPLYTIPGNHENNWSQSACKTFNDLFGNDRFVFTLNDRLVVIGMNCGPFMKMGDGHIKQEDLIWLDNMLRDMVKPGMKVLSVNHYPIQDDLDNYRAYVDILKKYPVITHQCGHYHQFKQYETDGIMGIMVRALDMGKGDYGYSVMDIDLNRNWIHIYNKSLGKDAELKFAYPISTNFYTEAVPSREINVPDGFSVDEVYADNASIFTRLSVDRDNIYFGNSLGILKALDKKSATVKWQYQTDAMLFSRPAVSDKYVVLPTADRRLVWLNKKNGARASTYDAAGPYVADGVVCDGVLYQGGYKTFQAWDVNKRKLLWHYDDINNYCQAAPVVDGNDVIFGAWDTYLRVLDRKTGALRWKWNNGINQNLYSPGNVVPVVTPDKVLIVAPDRVATALRRTDGSQIWREKNENKVRESLGVSADGATAYAKTMNGELVAMTTQGDEYKLLWKADAGFGYEHAPCIVLEHKGYVFMGSRRGMLAVFDAKTHRLVFDYPMGTSEVNGFDLDPEGNIYCSLIEGKIFRITVK